MAVPLITDNTIVHAADWWNPVSQLLNTVEANLATETTNRTAADTAINTRLNSTIASTGISDLPTWKTTVDAALARTTTTYLVADSPTRNNTVVLIDVGLTLAVAANTAYAIEGWLPYTSGGTPDIRFTLSAPAGATGSWQLFPVNSGAAAAGTVGSMEGVRITAFGDASPQAAAGSDASGGAMGCAPRGFVLTAATAGSLTWRFTQNAANVSDTVVKAGAWFRLARLS